MSSGPSGNQPSNPPTPLRKPNGSGLTLGLTAAGNSLPAPVLPTTRINVGPPPPLPPRPSSFSSIEEDDEPEAGAVVGKIIDESHAGDGLVRTGSALRKTRPKLGKGEFDFEGPLEADGELGYENFVVEGVRDDYIITGPRQKLVEACAARSIPDQNYISALLYTHHYYMSSRQLLETLLEIYHRELSDDADEAQRKEFSVWQRAIRGRVLNTLQRWVENIIEDIFDENLLEILLFFLEEVESDQPAYAQKLLRSLYKRKIDLNYPIEDKSLHKRLVLMVGRAEKAAASKKEESSTAPAAVEPDGKKRKKKGSTFGKSAGKKGVIPRGAFTEEKKFITPMVSDLTLDKIDAGELAEQITVLEEALFTSITPYELLDANWKKSNKATMAPHVVQLIDWFNRLDHLVASSIISCTNVKTRRLYLLKWIKTAEHCRTLRDYNALKAILSALQRTEVKRLAQTWKGVDKTVMPIYETLDELMSMSGNHKAYRDEFKASEPPHLPFIGVHLQDLLSLEELPNSLRENGFVNFKKMRKIWLAAEPILIRHQFPFQLKEHASIQKFLKDAPVFDDKELYKNSKALE